MKRTKKEIIKFEQAVERVCKCKSVLNDLLSESENAAHRHKVGNARRLFALGIAIALIVLTICLLN